MINNKWQKSEFNVMLMNITLEAAKKKKHQLGEKIIILISKVILC